MEHIGLSMDYYHRPINITKLDEHDDQYNHKIDCKIPLKPHQLTLLNKCLLREQKYISDLKSNKYESMYTDVGVIADKVGSGKSFVILSMILSNSDPLENRSVSVTYGSGSHFILNHKQVEYIDKDLNIIVVSHLLIKQWCSYIHAFCPDLSYCCINTKKSLLHNEEFNDVKLILCTGFMYKQLRGHFYLNNWRCKRIFFDEVDSTNTPTALYLAAKFVWFITASYRNILFPVERFYHSRMSGYVANGIQNNTFAKTLFTTTLKSMTPDELEVFDQIIIKNDDKYVEESLGLPDMEYMIILCKNPIEINVLCGLVNKDIISSINAGDIQTALSHIHSYNLDSETNIIAKVLNDLKTNLTNLEIKRNSIEMMVYNNEVNKHNLIKNTCLEIDRVKGKIEQISTRIVDNNLCPICYNQTCTKTISKCCNNSFCLSCITKWLTVQSNCPLCKHSCDIVDDFYIVKPSETVATTDNDQYIENYRQLPKNDNFTRELDKFCNLERVLMNRKSYSKFLIFSEFDYGFISMYPYLDKAGVQYSHLKGNQQQCNSLIYRYKNEDLDVLLINSKHYGSGLNLENTTDVVLFHKFEDQLEKQVIGRAQRTGRKLPLKVWYFLNELEN
jgi:SNF2 family DNA or RNA helicase